MMHKNMGNINPAKFRYIAVSAILLLLIAGSISSMPPHPQLRELAAVKVAAGEIPNLPSTSELHDRGICTDESFFNIGGVNKEFPGRAPLAGTFRVLGLLVDFSDHVSAVSAQFFDSLVFGVGSGTVHDYFSEISYGTLDLVTVNLPSSLGWNRAPQTYSYYVNGNYGYGSYPNNSQKLVEDIVDAVDGVVDFSQYDNDLDGYVDVLLVIHTGTGAELSGSVNDIWSHKWAISPRSKDGVLIKNYTIQPEFWNTPGDMTIGVYSHELCHGFGLPDLYDTDLSSNGIGDWGIMAYGSWNGSLGSSPAHPSAWSRIKMGFATSTNITSNTTLQSIPSVNSGGAIFRLWSSGAVGNEYFLVENRQRTGYDAGLPSSGLLIWHIDDNKVGNNEEWYPSIPGSQHYLVSLEQADALYSLDKGLNNGGTSDPFPGSGNKTSFNGATSPSSDGYTSGGSFVAVENISPSGATMTADLIVGIAAGINDNGLTSLPSDFSLSQNYPNPFNPSTNIEFELNSGSSVELNIYNLAGQRVKTLIDNDLPPGITTVTWDATNNAGKAVASGVYFYELIVDNSEESKKMLLVR